VDFLFSLLKLPIGPVAKLVSAVLVLPSYRVLYSIVLV
jgi:hypothetical protein